MVVLHEAVEDLAEPGPAAQCDPCAPVEVGRRDRPGRQRRPHEAEGLLADHQGLQVAAGGARGVDDREVEAAVAHVPDHLVGGLLDDRDRQVRVGEAHPLQQVAQVDCGERGDGPHPQLQVRAGRRRDRAPGLVDGGQGGAGVGLQGEGRRRRTHRSAGEQGRAELALEGPDLLAEARLGEVDAPGRPGEGARVEDRQEAGEVSELHVREIRRTDRRLSKPLFA